MSDQETKMTRLFEKTKNDSGDQKHRRNRGGKKGLRMKNKNVTGLSLLALYSLIVTQTLAQPPQEETLSSYGRSRTEGQQPNNDAYYVSFTGQDDGLLLPLAMPDTLLFDYTVMFWFRSAKSLAELNTDESILDEKAFLFELPGSAGCFVTRSSSGPFADDGPWLQCTPFGQEEEFEEDFIISLADLPDIQAWTHLTYSAMYSPDEDKIHSYLKVGDVYVKGPYMQMKDDIVYFGAGLDLKDGQGPRQGFAGDYRQFYYTLGYVEQDRIDLLKHQEKTLELEIRGYYMFQAEKYLNDAFRPQKATLLGSQGPTVVKEDEIAAPYCQSLPQELFRLPKFEQDPKDAFSKIPIDNFNNEQQNFGYTVSIWMKNSGQQSFSSDPKTGREENVLFSITDAFSIWFDTAYSLRVYVYSKNDYADVFTQDRILVPLHEWVNVQVTISATQGVTAMVFNANGDKVQLVHMEKRLGQMYPQGEMSIMKSFSGVAYTVQAWQRFIQLPVSQDMANRNEDMIADYNFSEGWTPKGGLGSTLSPPSGSYSWLYDNVPSKVNYNSKSLYGQLDATETKWNEVTCPNPVKSQIYFNGRGTGFKVISDDVSQTELTVEFWFRPDIERAQQLNQFGETYLFTMESSQFSSMTIYVNQLGQLICAPFGTNKQVEVVYEGVDLFNTDAWQHISCMFSDARFVKGQYLAVNLDLQNEGQPQDITQTLLLPQSFTESFTEKSEVLSTQWEMYVGNDKLFSKELYGSFKDIRLWQSVRSDAQLYQNRFKQVRSSQEPELLANFKLMDGDSRVRNEVKQSDEIDQFNLDLIESDHENLICAADTFFDPRTQQCVRNPFQRTNELEKSNQNAQSQILTYRNDVLSDSQYQMQLQSLSDSPLLLPGDDFQPKKQMRWSVNKSDPASMQYEEGDQNIFTTIDIGSNSQVADLYTFEYVMSDAATHDFFVEKQQIINPVKCHELVDTTTEEPFGSATVIIGSDSEQVEDLCMEFQVKRFSDSCGKEEPEDAASVIIRSQPDLLDGMAFVQASSEGVYAICIPKRNILEQTRLHNRPFNLVFTVPFDTESSVSYLDIVYKVALVSEIQPLIDFERNVLVSGEDESESLIRIDARNSRFTNHGNKNGDGLTFRWECELPFQESQCDKWAGSPILQISQGNAELETWYTFTVVVSSIAGGQDAVGFRFEERFIWTAETRPQFQLSVPTPLLVTADQQITINPETFRFSDDGYSYEFNFSPQHMLDDASKVQVSSAGNVLTIQAGALKWDTQYKINVKVFKQGVNAPGEEIHTFAKTAYWPLYAQNALSMEVLPIKGNMFRTDFEVTISEQFENTYEDDDLEFILLGGKFKDPDIQFRLMTTFEKLDFSENGNSNSKTLKLPEVQSIIARVQDEDTEFIEISTDVISERNDDQDAWFSQIQDLEQEFPSQDGLWQFYQQITLQANSDAAAEITTLDDAESVNGYIADKALEVVNGIDRSAISESDLITMKEMVHTFKQSSEYSQYVTDDTFETTIAVMNEVIEIAKDSDLIKGDTQFINDYVNLLGNLFQFQSNRGQEPSRRRRLLTSANLVNIETNLKDALCQQNENLILNGPIYKPRLGGDYEIQMIKVNKDYANTAEDEFKVLDAQFVSNNGDVQIELPIDDIVKQQFTEDSAAEDWICVTGIFYQGNRALKAEYLELQEDSYTVKMSTTDNNNQNRFAASSGGFTAAGGDTFNLVYKFDYESEFYDQAKTRCMFNEPDRNSEWSTTGCQTIKYEDSSTMGCICDSLYDYQYAIVTDRTPDDALAGDNDRVDNIFILMFIVLPLFLFGVFLPCALDHLDKQDYNELHASEEDKQKAHIVNKQIKVEVISKFEKARKKASKHEIYFNEFELQRYQEYSDLGCWTGFKTFNRTLHPFISLFMHYDYKFSRLTRFTMVLGQVSLITLLNWLCFAKAGHEIFGNDFKERLVFVSLLLSLITLPLPMKVYQCIERQIYVLRDEQEAPVDMSKEQMVKTKPGANSAPASARGVIAPQDIDLDFEHGGETTTEQGEEQRATLMEPCINCKKFFLILIYVFWAFALGLSIAFMFFTTEKEGEDEEEGFNTYLELTTEEAWYVVVSWYLAIFGWGWLGLNEIRIILCSLLAPIQAKKIKNRNSNQNQKTPSKILKSHEEPLSCVTCALIPRQSVEISLDVLYFIDIIENPDDYEGENFKFIDLNNLQPAKVNSQMMELGQVNVADSKPAQENKFIVGERNAKTDVKQRQPALENGDAGKITHDDLGESLDQQKQSILLQGGIVQMKSNSSR